VNLKSQAQVDQLLLYKNEALDGVIEWTGTNLFTFLNNPLFEVTELEKQKQKQCSNLISLLDLFAILYDRGLVSKSWSTLFLCFNGGSTSFEDS
jgi:hypothetical protein